MTIQRPNTLPNLEQFYGTETWYRHPLFRKFLYTDGIQHVAQSANAYWLLDSIFAHAHDLYKQQKSTDERLFLVFNLTVKEDDSATLSIDNGNNKLLVKQNIHYTDFPAKTFKCYVTDHVCLLPSEY